VTKPDTGQAGPGTVTRGNMLRVLAVDATPLVREGLRTVIQQTVRLGWVGGTDQPDVIRHELASMRPHVVLVDSAVDPHGALIRDLVAADPTLTVVSLFRDYDRNPASLRVAQLAGAHGLLSRDSEPACLVRALLDTHRTRRFVDPHLVHVFGSRKSDRARQLLTARQRQVLAMVARGMSEADIAEQLCISQATVNSHVKKLRRRLGARDRAHAVALAYRLGILPGPDQPPHQCRQARAVR
jgi:DNA-binding NarL/FixJ family response regulator